MAVNSLGIYPNEQGKPIGSSKRIGASDGTYSGAIRFSTQSNAWTKANVWVVVYAVGKAGTESINAYGYVGEAGVLNKARTSFTAVSGSVADGYVWAIPFSSVTGLSALLGTLSYSGRSYDAIRLEVMVRCYWGDTEAQSEKRSADCYIGFIPTYAPGPVWYDANGLNIGYTAAGWNRPNDRYAVASLVCGGKAVAASATGTVSAAGTVTIPKSKVRYIPATGETVTGSVRMSGSWQGTSQTLNTLAVSGTVANLYDAKTPTLALSISDEGVTATVGQTGSGSSLDYVEVSMVGGGFQADRAQIPVGGSHTFSAVPFNVPTQWQAVGYTSAAGELAMSDAVTADADAVGGPTGATFTASDGSTVHVPYNVTYNAQARPEASTVKTAGRERPTVGFGEGGEVTWTITGTVCTEGMDGLETTDEDALRALPESGVQVVRFPNGERAQVYVTNCGIARAVGAGALRSVSISAEEVAS